MTKPKVDVSRLEEIQEEMIDLLDEASRIVRGAGGQVYERARAYWLAHVETALHRDHSYLGSSMVTMEDTIRDLKQGDEDDE